MKVAAKKRDRVASDALVGTKVNVADSLMEALRLADEAEAVASLLDAYLIETGPSVVHAAARSLARTARQLGRELCVLIDRDDEARRRRWSRARRG